VRHDSSDETPDEVSWIHLTEVMSEMSTDVSNWVDTENTDVSNWVDIDASNWVDTENTGVSKWVDTDVSNWVDTENTLRQTEVMTRMCVWGGFV